MTIEEIDTVLGCFDEAAAALERAGRAIRASDILWCRVAVGRLVGEALVAVRGAKNVLEGIRRDVVRLEAGEALQ